MIIDVCFVPAEYDAKKYEGYTAVVIDVFRATTTMAAAFTNGCAGIIPVKTVEEAFAKRDEFGGKVMLAGERGGVLIEGFDLGNSPFEYTEEVIGGKTLVMTTTNGTFALNTVLSAPCIYTASLASCEAVCRALREDGRDVVVVCAGTERRFSVEDTLCAGLIADRLSDIATLRDKACAAQAMYQGYRADSFEERVTASSHGVYLTERGFAHDVAHCLRHDIYDVAPIYRDGIITVGE